MNEKRIYDLDETSRKTDSEGLIPGDPVSREGRLKDESKDRVPQLSLILFENISTIK